MLRHGESAQWLRIIAVASAIGCAGIGCSLILGERYTWYGLLVTMCVTSLALLVQSGPMIRSRGRRHYHDSARKGIPLLSAVITMACVMVIIAITGSPPFSLIFGVAVTGAAAFAVGVPFGFVYTRSRPFRESDLRVPSRHCQCGYRIDNIPGPRCPECGERFAPDRDTVASEK